MESVLAVAFVAVLLVVSTWWLLLPIGVGCLISVIVTAVRESPGAGRLPGLWARLGIGSALLCAATVGYGMTRMATSFRLDADDPCTLSDDLLDNHPIIDWPLSDTGCRGYESVPAFVNPLILLFAALFSASVVAMVTTWRRQRARPAPSESTMDE
ncbi:hypothetical protein [Saccharopolyspora kobensis]|uniref:hypothetical protein n=1 Tax=Saccharopolyspora kobensis TaxID=146035 RepID=UPI001160E379|nr:hypothetical protein [Saccharopolyspora kobensis]